MFYYNYLYFLNNEYPNFSYWYRNLFDKNLKLNNNRKIFICTHKNDIAGIIILKKSNSEKKISTLRVDKRYRNNGIGKSLIKLGIEWLEDDKPLITVNENKIYQFKYLFNYFGFKLKDQINCYNKYSKELFFNSITDNLSYERYKFINTNMNIIYNINTNNLYYNINYKKYDTKILLKETNKLVYSTFL
ncbi:GNAT family N-acetyltransferase [Brachyspira hampsonii]|uniref:GNAT family N-acetyltransferase n=1 Tax=Brachyspira hampsonii TaxID=1287055 RepID=UPI001C675374|nr:GNAT family N-acetyltransferase [Brachyspira hampsonii]MBW5390660.1 N-acetyltransferase [Brachyspira hampsonii]